MALRAIQLDERPTSGADLRSAAGLWPSQGRPEVRPTKWISPNKCANASRPASFNEAGLKAKDRYLTLSHRCYTEIARDQAMVAEVAVEPKVPPRS